MADQEEVATKHCSNCKRDIPAINYVMHQNHCQRNIKLCEHCQEPVPRSEMDTHFEEEHKKVPCKCGESIEICKLEEHEAKHCPSRPAKCDYCELELPYAKISEHKNFCGSRTERCEKCNRYIQLKDQDVHAVSECTYPEVQTQPKTKPLSHFIDHSDGFDASVLDPEWHGMWHDQNVQSFFTRGNSQRSASDLFDLISPTTNVSWNPSRDAGGANRSRTGHQGVDAMTRRHIKNRDRVQNSFGVTGKKPVSGSKPSGLSRPWEKNEEREQNRSQEESDRLLAMHLAQDLQGSRLTPEELPNSFLSQDTLDYPGEIDIDKMLKEAYDIPAINTYQEPKFTVSSPTVVSESTDANTTMLPCEFCQECFPSDILIEHQSGCRPDVSSYTPKSSSTNNNRQQPLQGLPVRPHIHDNLGQNLSSPEWMSLPAYTEPENKSPSIDVEDDNTVMLPCEFCGDLLPSEFLSHHQVNCTENGSQTPAPPTMDSNPPSRHTVHTSPTRPRPRRVPIPTSLELNQRPVKHQADPSLDVLMASPDSKPSNEETSPRHRHTGQSRSRKTKVTSTVTRPGGHGVNLAITPSPVDKYLNGSPCDRDVSNGIIGAKPRVVTVEKKVRGERPLTKSSSRGQYTTQKVKDITPDEAGSVETDENVVGLYAEPAIRSKGKSSKSSSYSTPSTHTTKDLNNRQKQATKLRTKPLKTSSVGRGGDVQYQASFGGASEDRRRGSRDKNNQHANTKSTNRTRHHVVNLEPDDDLGPPLRLKTSNQSSGGAKPKQKRPPKKLDDDTV